MTSGNQHNGFEQIASSHPVDETIDRLESRLKEHGITLFARLDFAADAARVGSQHATRTHVDFRQPESRHAVDAGRAGVGAWTYRSRFWSWERTPKGKTWVAYNRPDYIVARHGLPAGLAANLAGAIPLIEGAAR